MPVIFCSPHSGREYSDGLRSRTSLALEVLRRSEDAYVDELIDCANEFGATTLVSECPRVFVDVNRGPLELDPKMFSDRVPGDAIMQSRRAISGLGVVPRIGADGRQLYSRRMKFREAEALLADFYTPYHQALTKLIDDMKAKFGRVVLIDTHSMPEHSARGADFVLGDRFGASCSPDVTRRVESLLREQGFVTVRNTPYAGGYTTEHYGRPESGVHVLQIEINRGLYLEERRVVRSREFESFSADFRNIIKNITLAEWANLLPS